MLKMWGNSVDDGQFFLVVSLNSKNAGLECGVDGNVNGTRVLFRDVITADYNETESIKYGKNWWWRFFPVREFSANKFNLSTDGS